MRKFIIIKWLDSIFMSLVLIHQFMESILSNSIVLTCGITLGNTVLLLIMIADLMSDLVESVVATNSNKCRGSTLSTFILWKIDEFPLSFLYVTHWFTFACSWITQIIILLCTMWLIYHSDHRTTHTNILHITDTKAISDHWPHDQL